MQLQESLYSFFAVQLLREKFQSTTLNFVYFSQTDSTHTKQLVRLRKNCILGWYSQNSIL